MKHINVNLNQKRTTANGKTYIYWALRWFGSNGKAHVEHIGRVDGPNKMSRRQANLILKRKEQLINHNSKARDRQRASKLSGFLDKYLKARKHDLAERTWPLHNQTAKYLLAHFGGDIEIDEISKSMARDFKTALANGDLKQASQRPRILAAETIETHMRNCRKMFNFAIEDEEITKNPFRHLCCNVSVETAWHYVSQDEYQKLSDAAPNMTWQLLFALCRLAGLRRGEALNLEWSDIDWAQNSIQIVSKTHWKTKTRKARKVPMVPELQSLLSSAIPTKDGDGGLIIKGFYARNCHRDFKVIRKGAGVEPYAKPFHSMRKSFAQDLADGGTHPHSLHRWMGHTKFEVTMKYYLTTSQVEHKRLTGTSFFDELVQKGVQNDGREPIKNNVDMGIKNV